MFGWSEQRGNRGEAAEEGRKALEVRLSRLEGEVHEALRKVEAVAAREVAREAAFQSAIDQLSRLSERTRKYAESERRARGAAGDGAESSAEDDAFWQLWHRRAGVVPAE